ncbi:hypothetical protein BH11ARM1_BH11ARM1_00680 [soil metagenome]
MSGEFRMFGNAFDRCFGCSHFNGAVDEKVNQFKFLFSLRQEVLLLVILEQPQFWGGAIEWSYGFVDCGSFGSNDDFDSER